MRATLDRAARSEVAGGLAGFGNGGETFAGTTAALWRNVVEASSGLFVLPAPAN